jgi:hypothetical protein
MRKRGLAGDDHLRPVACAAQSDCTPDTATRPGDKNSLVAQIIHGLIPHSRSGNR